MTDYTKATGSSGTMLIRDTGTTVEFWLKASSSTFNHDLPWAYVVNGTTSSWREFDFETGGSYQKLGGWTVSTSQTVTFKLGDTGTSGLGGPTNFSVSIDRASPPSAPSQVTFSGLFATSVTVSFSDGANNGAAIDSRQLARNTSNTLTGATIISSDGSTSVTGLSAGTYYWFWARTHNSEGYSPWGPVRAIKTLNVPAATSAAILTSITQTSVVVNFSPNDNGGTAITGYDLGYSLTTLNSSGMPVIPGGSPSPGTVVSATSPMTVTGLSPGKGYVFWVRAKNSIGNGPWSEARGIVMIAGARILDGTVYKNAVPYVRDGGVWKLARPWVKDNGTWKESS